MKNTTTPVVRRGQWCDGAGEVHEKKVNFRFLFLNWGCWDWIYELEIQGFDLQIRGCSVGFTNSGN